MISEFSSHKIPTYGIPVVSEFRHPFAILLNIVKDKKGRYNHIDVAITTRSFISTLQYDHRVEKHSITQHPSGPLFQID